MQHSAKHIADRIRLMITTKQFQVGEMLPSTRELGKQLGASFHTVRKAYQQLADEGLIESEQGRGFLVRQQSTTLDKSERLELAAEKFQMLLEELIGYGLDESEVEAIFEEQISFMEWPDRIQSIATVGETIELAKLLSDSIKNQIGVKSSVIKSADYDDLVRYDALFVPIYLVNEFRNLSDAIRLLPVVFHYDADVLLSIIDRSGIEAIGLVTAEEDSIPKIIDELKTLIKFEGAFVAGATYGKSLPLFVRNTDLIVYTPASARLVEAKIPEKSRIKLEYIISEKSAEMIRAELWDQ
ncbi:GntR family transcriptional regulator [Rhodohalobacter sulfatireducens]|uniref:GntR family transcriptional regulator n=1 Tax=Rhodohalobacter sulfatireducens TaxID=2911366 RepID=A0ABS9KHK5_9BACT|nr:GntR family transcriptional regulator [Rhodohalobacter sulfatireducens]MCG2590316.1 GntR family transcriptional regulator [Rhodohalobacter sulfatireducens]MDR9364768.1 GntR family transcriptional regulator [Balneolaceae bacterium]MDR9409636.1 GntR family transcriptional regulator [Balneolaceae bacterium]